MVRLSFVIKQDPVNKFDASDFVNLALSPIPSTFGRLVLLAELRDYTADELAELLYGKEQIAAALQQKHRDIFFAWLGLNRASQVAEVEKYLADRSGNDDRAIAELAQLWAREKVYEKLRPTAASESERELFSSHLRDILQLRHKGLDSSGENHGG